MKLKLLSAFLAVASMVSLANIFGIRTIQNLYHQFENIVQHTTPSIIALKDLREGILLFQIETLKRTISQKSDEKTILANLEQSIQQWKIHFSFLTTTPQEYQIQSDLEVSLKELFSEGRTLLKTPPGKYIQHRTQNLNQKISQSLALINKALEKEKTTLQDQYPSAQNNALWAISLHTIVMVAVIILALLLGFIVSSRLSYPLVELKKAAEEVERGNWTVKVNISSRDEVGVLGSTFNKMVETLAKTTVSRDYMEKILNTMMSVLLILDGKGRIRKINQRALELLNYQEEELLQKEASLILEGEYPLPQKKTHNLERNFLNREGKKIPLLFSITQISNPEGDLEEILWMGQDLRERKRLEKEILEISEREQLRIGQDLHDGLGQLLTGIALLAKNLEQKLLKGETPKRMEMGEIVKLVNSAISQSRHLARGLYPVDVEPCNLPEALKQLCQRSQELFGISFSLDTTEEIPPQDPSMVFHLYRIAQEAIHNAVRHGETKKIHITLQREEDRFFLTIRDEGQGLSSSSSSQEKGMGIRIMEYRARMIGGNLRIFPHQDRGTVVQCLWEV